MHITNPIWSNCLRKKRHSKKTNLSKDSLPRYLKPHPTPNSPPPPNPLNLKNEFVTSPFATVECCSGRYTDNTLAELFAIVEAVSLLCDAAFRRLAVLCNQQPNNLDIVAPTPQQQCVDSLALFIHYPFKGFFYLLPGCFHMLSYTLIMLKGQR